MYLFCMNKYSCCLILISINIRWKLPKHRKKNPFPLPKTYKRQWKWTENVMKQVSLLWRDENHLKMDKKQWKTHKNQEKFTKYKENAAKNHTKLKWNQSELGQEWKKLWIFALFPQRISSEIKMSTFPHRKRILKPKDEKKCIDVSQWIVFGCIKLTSFKLIFLVQRFCHEQALMHTLRSGIQSRNSFELKTRITLKGRQALTPLEDSKKWIEFKKCLRCSVRCNLCDGHVRSQ